MKERIDSLKTDKNEKPLAKWIEGNMEKIKINKIRVKKGY
jgi:hypothetical protein